MTDKIAALISMAGIALIVWGLSEAGKRRRRRKVMRRLARLQVVRPYLGDDEPERWMS